MPKGIYVRNSIRPHRNLIGKKFGRWIVIDNAPSRKQGKNTTRFWICKCSCGNERMVSGQNLWNGKSKSCGCLRVGTPILRNRKDLSGKRFGKLVVIKQSKDLYNTKGRAFPAWECVCDCGNKKIVKTCHLLRSKGTTSCGCNRRINLVGKRFGKLVVLDIEKVKNNVVFRLCQCDCGDKKFIRTTSLVSRGTISCGCLQVDLLRQRLSKDLIGKKFGKLTVIKKDIPRIKLNGHRVTRWICRCDCGNTLTTNQTSLMRGDTKSCGCLRESFIANKLKTYLIKKYHAIPEYKILQHPKNRAWMPYDIYIPDNIFIEVNGLQHYQYVKHFQKNLAGFKVRIFNDKIKRKFAKDHGTYIEVDLRKIKTVEEAIAYIEERL